MKKSIIALGICGIILIGAGAFWFGLDDETRGVLKTLPTNKDVLLWSQQQRDATFRAFDRLTILADHHTMKASSAPMPW